MDDEAPAAIWSVEGPDEDRPGGVFGVTLSIYQDGTGYLGATRDEGEQWSGLELSRAQVLELRAALLAAVVPADS
ncbi:MAG TPA: hypothetical protein VKX16_12370 [Chloroflexota bacterium]|nr:hypothetical protein [Chloroflexota bacterium]